MWSASRGVRLVTPGTVLVGKLYEAFSINHSMVSFGIYLKIGRSLTIWPLGVVVTVHWVGRGAK
jgi:hypothetical protein